VATRGQQFLSEDLYIQKTGKTVVLSGSVDGTSGFFVDGLLPITVTHQDGSIRSVSFDDSNRCTSSTVLTTAPFSLAPLLAPGFNHLHLTMSDSCGGNYGHSDVWVTGAVNFLAPPYTPPTLDGWG
jgi:hypothetical protein